jgi:hypothetical protein
MALKVKMQRSDLRLLKEVADLAALSQCHWT